MNEPNNKQSITRLIYEVDNYHGLVLFVPNSEPNDPNRGINCKFEDFDWLRRNPDPEGSEPFSNLPPTSPNRITVWLQSNRGAVKKHFYSPQQALEKFQELMESCGKTWEDIVVVWSHPRNQPKWQQDEHMHLPDDKEVDSQQPKENAALMPSKH